MMNLKVSFKRYKKKYAAFIAVVMSAGVLLSCNYMLYGLWFTFLLVLAGNLVISRKISWNATHLFSTIGRNYEALVIGDICPVYEIVGKVEKIISFTVPERSLLSSYELTRRLYSLLQEDDGILYVVYRERFSKTDKLSVLDIPYLHEIQLAKYKIRNHMAKKYLPLVFAPVLTIKYLLNVVPHSFKEADGGMSALDKFCKERNITIKYIKVK